MKIASWNVNSLRVRQEQVCAWLTETDTDILCLQELKLSDDEFPAAEFEALGYHCYFTGQKTYNGVAIVSKPPLTAIEKDLPDYDDPMRRYISGELELANGDTLRIINVYCPNGQALDSDKFIYKQEWFAKLKAAVNQHLGKHSHLVLLGDFNITPTDLDVHDPKQWQGKIHCSETERLMLQSLMSEGIYDTYRHFESQGEKFSWWDYRGAGYRANAGLRIDLILSNAALLDAATSSHIDEAPRKLERPSDHTPVVAEFSI